MSIKKPTDAAIIKGFEKFEQGFNVAIAYYKTLPGDLPLMFSPEIEKMFEAHRSFLKLAHDAQARIDRKKQEKERITA